jgi:hypothetical protein
MNLEKTKAAEELLAAEREYVKAQAAVREGGRMSHTVMPMPSRACGAPSRTRWRSRNRSCRGCRFRV